MYTKKHYGLNISIHQYNRNVIMVKLKFIVYTNSLVLRISEGKERFYKSAMSLLKGQPNLMRHWNDKRERFSSYAVFCDDNNKILDDLKEMYQKLIFEHPEYSAREVV